MAANKIYLSNVHYFPIRETCLAFAVPMSGFPVRFVSGGFSEELLEVWRP